MLLASIGAATSLLRSQHHQNEFGKEANEITEDHRTLCDNSRDFLLFTMHVKAEDNFSALLKNLHWGVCPVLVTFTREP